LVRAHFHVTSRSSEQEEDVTPGPALSGFRGHGGHPDAGCRPVRQGVSQADIGRELKVSHQSISDWHKQWLVGGKQALKRTGQPGRPRKVTDAELAKVERALEKGPKSNGYPTDLWTLARVAEVIERTTGVKYHPGHVWKVLRRMGWSRQRPARQAAERDDEAIEQWVNDRWPKLKKTLEPGAPGSSSRTRAGSASSPR
jgi:transposase